MTEKLPPRGRLGATSDLELPEAYCPQCDRSFAPGTKHCPNDGTKLVHLETPQDPLIGRTIDGRFEVRSRLAQGGMGVVYRAWQTSVGREVALKVVDSSLIGDRETAKRFLREARLCSRLSQGNIVVVHDFGHTDDGILYLVMELVEGRTLQDILRESGPMPRLRAIDIALQICDALEAAHEHGVVHRDLKPSNIMLLDQPADRDVIKVLDFGLAKSIEGSHSTITQEGSSLGTPAYMSPEAISGSHFDGRGDLYSLGVLLFELIAGTPPFSADTISALCMHHLHTRPPALNTGPGLAALVKRLLAKDAKDRYQTAQDTRSALMACKKEEESPGEYVERREQHPTFAIDETLPSVTNALTDGPSGFRWSTTKKLLLLVGAASVGTGLTIFFQSGRSATPTAAPFQQEATPDLPRSAPIVVPDASTEAEPSDAAVDATTRPREPRRGQSNSRKRRPVTKKNSHSSKGQTTPTEKPPVDFLRPKKD